MVRERLERGISKDSLVMEKRFFLGSSKNQKVIKSNLLIQSLEGKRKYFIIVLISGLLLLVDCAVFFIHDSS